MVLLGGKHKTSINLKCWFLELALGIRQKIDSSVCVCVCVCVFVRACVRVCRDGTCCWLLIIITRFSLFCSYFPIVLLAHVLDLIGGGRSILSNHS